MTGHRRPHRAPAPTAASTPPAHSLPRRRVAAIGAAAIAAGVLGAAAPAAAAGTDPEGRSAANGALSWIRLRDSSDISVWQLDLSLGQGGLTNPGLFFWSLLIELLYEVHRLVAVIAIWLIDWSLSFGWLPLVASPVQNIANSLSDTLGDLDVVVLFLTIAAVASAVWLLRGAIALGLYELAMSLLLATLAAGALANPVGVIAGDNGMLLGSRDLGLALSEGLSSGEVSENADTSRDAMTATLVDTFVRTPAQLLTFGTVLDGGPCQSAFDEAVSAGPYVELGKPQIREAVGACDPELQETAENPNVDTVAGAITLILGSLIVLGFAGVVSIGIVLSAVTALYQAVKLIVVLLVALLPGNARTPLWMCVGDLVMALVGVTASVVFLTGYLLFLQAVFAADTTTLVERMFVVNVLLIVGLILYVTQRKRLKASAGGLAKWLSTRPGPGGQAQPAPRGNLAGAALGYASDVAGLRHYLKRPNPTTPSTEDGPTGPPGESPRASTRVSPSESTSVDPRTPGRGGPGPAGQGGPPAPNGPSGPGGPAGPRTPGGPGGPGGLGGPGGGAGGAGAAAGTAAARLRGRLGQRAGRLVELSSSVDAAPGRKRDVARTAAVSAMQVGTAAVSGGTSAAAAAAASTGRRLVTQAGARQVGRAGARVTGGLGLANDASSARSASTDAATNRAQPAVQPRAARTYPAEVGAGRSTGGTAASPRGGTTASTSAGPSARADSASGRAVGGHGGGPGGGPSAVAAPHRTRPTHDPAAAARLRDELSRRARSRNAAQPVR